MMDNDPEVTARADGEEKGPAEQPRISELLRPHDRADYADDEADHRNHRADERQPGKPAALEVFAFRRGQDVASLAHCFSSSVRASGGTSAAVSFWVRCSARR